MSPSLCGADEYAKSIRKSSKPSQRFYVFNEKVEKLLIILHSKRG